MDVTLALLGGDPFIHHVHTKLTLAVVPGRALGRLGDLLARGLHFGLQLARELGGGVVGHRDVLGGGAQVAAVIHGPVGAHDGVAALVLAFLHRIGDVHHQIALAGILGPHAIILLGHFATLHRHIGRHVQDRRALGVHHGDHLRELLRVALGIREGPDAGEDARTGTAPVVRPGEQDHLGALLILAQHRIGERAGAHIGTALHGQFREDRIDDDRRAFITAILLADDHRARCLALVGVEHRDRVLAFAETLHRGTHGARAPKHRVGRLTTAQLNACGTAAGRLAIHRGARQLDLQSVRASEHRHGGTAATGGIVHHHTVRTVGHSAQVGRGGAVAPQITVVAAATGHRANDTALGTAAGGTLRVQFHRQGLRKLHQHLIRSGTAIGTSDRQRVQARRVHQR